MRISLRHSQTASPQPSAGVRAVLLACLAAGAGVVAPARADVAGAPDLTAALMAGAASVQPRVVAWRRDIHQHPELANHEVRTAKLVADHLRSLGLEVRTGVAVTGVIGILKGGKPGGVVALRADMDALPVEEKTGLPFASKVVTLHEGKQTPVMHACGHDAHTAILMGAAQVLASVKSSIPGTVVFLFQPAEEGTPAGEASGAELVISEGALRNPKPDAIVGLHVIPGPVGQLEWRAGPYLAASDRITIQLKGIQTHGAEPWAGIDIISMAADIVSAFNQIAARQLNVIHSPGILTIAAVNGGTKYNIIPEELTMLGTLRTFDPAMRKQAMAKAEAAVTGIAARYGGSGKIVWEAPTPATINDESLTALFAPVLASAADGKTNDHSEYSGGSEDFAYYRAEMPSFFYQLGIGSPKGTNHSPYFDVVDEASLQVGVRAQALAAVRFLMNATAQRE